MTNQLADGWEPERFAVDTNPDGPPEGERWSSWDGSMHGPKPRPDWVITALGAVDADLGVLKTGKEADVHLLQRWVPGDPSQDVVPAELITSFLTDAGDLRPPFVVALSKALG